MARSLPLPALKLYWEGGSPQFRDALASGQPVEWVQTPAEADLIVGPPPESYNPSGLTNREAEVLSYLADGWSNEEMADRLGIVVRTVKFHLDRIYRKLGVNRRTEAVREAVMRGYLRF
jgi:DNA-binding NarL/FixJ family response regulator